MATISQIPNESGTEVVLASAARTTTTNSTVQHNTARGVQLVIDVTSVTSTPSVVFKIQGYDELSNKYYDLLTSAAITGAGTTVVTLYPGIAETANVRVSNALPVHWRVNATHGDADSITYSVGATYLSE